MNVGDYVRTPYGIRKVKSIAKHDKYQDDGFYVEDRFIVCGKEAMKEIKSSPNIIGLIEEGDILKLLDVQYDKEYKTEVILDYNDNLCVIDFENNKIIDLKESLFKKDIKLLSIVTKEQFESMEYKIGEK